MKRFANAVRLFTFAFALLAFVPGLYAQDKEAAYKKVVTIEGITEYSFPNGLRFLSFPDPSSPTVTINMTVLVGSRHEGYGETGMAHLLEHMLFKGAKLYPTVEILDKAMQSRGVSKKEYNATTWVDRTNYYEAFPASDDNLRFALEMEADRLHTAFIRREDLAKEMSVVRNEFEIGENNPRSILNQRMMAVAFEWHNYGKSTIGNRADIERVPAERLHAFYKKYYRVDNVVLVVSGKFDEKKALAHVSKYFGVLKAPATPIEKTYTEEPAQDGERSVTLRRVGKVAVAGLMYHIPATAHEDNAACEILGLVLGDTPSGRLFKTLVEKKKATSIDYNVTNWHDPGTIEMTAQVLDGVRPEEVRDLMIAELEKLAEKPITEDEVKRMVRKYLSFRAQVMTKSTATALELSEWIGAGDWRLLFVHRDRIAKLKAADVNRVAVKYLRSSNRTAGLFLPTLKATRTPIPQGPNIANLVKDFKGGKAVAKGESFDATPENIEKRVRRLQLKSGLKVALFPKKSRGETVSGRLTLRFGNEESLVGNEFAAAALGTMLVRGTKNRSRQQIVEQLDILKSSLNLTSGLGVLNVTWDTKRGQHDKVLGLIREILREPTFPAAELAEIKQLRKQGIEQTMVDPQGLAINALLRTLNPHPPTSIHYVPTHKESLARLAKLKREDVAKLYQEQVGGAVGELALVGDFDSDDVLKQLETIFSDWTPTVPYRRIPSVLVKDVKATRLTINTPDKENAVFVAAFTFPLDDSAADYPALEMGNEILGGSFTSRLVDRFRQKEGWSYGASSYLSVGAKDKVSRFLIYASCEPKVMEKADKAASEELDRIVKKGVTEEELRIAIKSTLENLRQDRGKDGTLASLLREGLYLKRTFAYQAELEKKIAAVTVKDVNRALAAHLSSGRLVIVRAGDFNKKK
ncbi:MAG: insulinase family protein [Planctomycetes bacterium]|nr:insulinase family protein [Planctomycetota bacterium]